MADPIATAFVLIKPDTRRFATDLKNAVKAATTKPIEINVKPKMLAKDLTALKQQITDLSATINVKAVVTGKGITDLRKDIAAIPSTINITTHVSDAEIQRLQQRIAAIKATVSVKTVAQGQEKAAGKAAPVVKSTAATTNVPVTPNMAGFKSALSEAVKEAAKNIQVKVPVGLTLAPGAKAQLLKDIKAIKGAVVPVSVQATGAVQASAKAPVAAVVKRAAPATSAAAAPAAKKVTTEDKNAVISTKALADALIDKEAAEKKVARAQGVIASKTKDLTTLTEEGTQATRAAAAAEAARVKVFKVFGDAQTKQAVAERRKAQQLADQGQRAADTITQRRAAAQQKATDAAASAAEKKADQKAKERQDRKDSAAKRAADREAGVADRAQTKKDNAAKKAADKLAADQQKRITTAKDLATDVKDRVATRKAAARGVGQDVARAQVALLPDAKGRLKDLQQAAKATLDVAGANKTLTAAVKDEKAARSALAKARLTSDKGLIRSAQADVKRTQDTVKALRDAVPEAKRLQGQLGVAQRIAEIPNAGASADTELLKSQARETASAGAVKAAKGQVKIADEALAKSTNAATIAAKKSADALLKEALAAEVDAKAQRELAQKQEARGRTTSRVAKGAAAAGLSFAGLRAQVLAASGPFIAGTVAVTALQKSFQAFANLEQTLNVFQATTGATADQMERVSEVAKQLGADVTLPAVSAQDAAEAMSQLARAGLTVQESIDATRGVLELSTAANISNADATTFVASALNSFGLAGNQAVRVADLLAGASISAQGEISDFGQAMAQVNAVANQVGVSVEDTTALLTLLAKGGLRGSDAGTSLRTAFLKLVSPTKEARAAINALGIEIRNTQGQIRPEVFADFANATRDMAPEVRDAIAAQIFGQDAIRAALIAGNAGAKGLNDMRDSTQEQGLASKLSEAQTKGLSGSLDALKSSAQTAATNLGSILAPAFKILTDQVTGLVTDVNFLLESLNDLKNFRPDFPDFLPDIPKPDVPFIDVPFADDFGKAGKAAGKFFLDVQRFGPLIAAVRAKQRGFGDDASAAFLKSGKDAKAYAAGLLKGPAAPFSALQLLTEGMDATSFEASQLGKQLVESLDFLKNTKGATGDEIDAAKEFVENTLARLASLGPEGRAVIQNEFGKIGPFLDQTLREQLESFTGLSTLTNQKIPEELQTTIDQMVSAGAAGIPKLEAVGKLLAEAFADGVGDNQAAADAVANAREAVSDAIEAGKAAVASSVETAKGNLESFGDSLADAFEKIIDANPVAEKIKQIDKELDALEERTTRRSLRFNLGQAKEDLEDLRKTLVTIGAPNAAQQKQIAKVLRPLKEDVFNKTVDIKKFNLTDKKGDFEDIQTAAKKAARDGIEVLVDQFLAGKISAGDFAKRLSGQLQPALDILKTKAGKNLGMRFEKSFTNQVDDLVKQAQFLVGFLGSAPVSKAVDPAKTKKEQAATVQKARENLAAAIKAQIKTQENTARGGPLEVAVRAVETAITRAKRNAAKTTVPKPRTKEPDQTTGTVKSGP